VERGIGFKRFPRPNFELAHNTNQKLLGLALIRDDRYVKELSKKHSRYNYRYLVIRRYNSKVWGKMGLKSIKSCSKTSNWTQRTPSDRLRTGVPGWGAYGVHICMIGGDFSGLSRPFLPSLPHFLQAPIIVTTMLFR
jgi:hypothetical protein